MKKEAMKRKGIRQIFSFALCLAMCLSLTPATSFAAESAEMQESPSDVTNSTDLNDTVEGEGLLEESFDYKIESLDITTTNYLPGKSTEETTVTCNTKGLTIVSYQWDVYVQRQGYKKYTGLFEEGEEYALLVFLNHEEGYDYSALTRDEVTVDGKKPNYFDNPWYKIDEGEIRIFNYMRPVEEGFIVQPISKTSEPGKPCEIAFETIFTEEYVNLQKNVNGTWKDYYKIEPGLTTYTIPYGTPGDTDQFRLSVFNRQKNEMVYGNPFKITWSHYFEQQPVGGISEPYKMFWIDYWFTSEDTELELEKFDKKTGNWLDVFSIESGQDRFGFREWHYSDYILYGQTITYRLCAKVSDSQVVYSDEFDVTWAPVRFTTQPVSGTSEAGKPYTITFDSSLTNQSVCLQKNGGSISDWSTVCEMEPGTTTYDIPYGTPGTSDWYRLAVLDYSNSTSGDWMFSDEFKVTWGKNIFVKQPKGGTRSLNENHQIAFAAKDYAEGATFELQSYGTSKRGWTTEGTIESPYTIPGKAAQGAVGYRIVCTYNGNKFYSDEFAVLWSSSARRHTYSTGWSRDKYGHWHASLIDKNVISGFAAHTPGPAATITEPQTCTVCGYVIARVQTTKKDNLLIIPNAIEVGSVLEVNTDELTDDDFIDGYLEGNITWVYTSEAGEVSRYRFPGDPEKFTVTEDVIGGTVYCELYNSNESAAWISSEVKLEEEKAPEIITQPEDETVEAGKKASFSIVATGEGLTYQWYISKDNASTWIASNTTSGKSADYEFTTSATMNGYLVKCVVTNANKKSVTSDAVKLTVTPAGPVITTQPKAASVTAGTKAKFSIAATGTGLTYQWYISKDNASTWIASNTTSGKSADYEFTTSATMNGYLVKCVVTDANKKSVTSNAVKLTVTAAGPVITTQPVAASVPAGTKAKFSIAATGTGLTYQWYISKDNGSNWIISNTTSGKLANYSFTTSSAMNGYLVKCVVTDANKKSVTSDAVKLTVIAAGPVITTQPVAASVTAGNRAKFRISVTGTGLSYQWYISKDNGSTWSASNTAAGKTAEYLFTTSAAMNGYLVKCVVTDANKKSVTSNAVTLTVTAAGPVITTQPKAATVTAGSKAKFNIAATGTGLTYQWYISKDNGSNWIASNTTSGKTAGYEFTTSAAMNGYLVKCVVTDANKKSVTSSLVKLTVN